MLKPWHFGKKFTNIIYAVDKYKQLYTIIAIVLFLLISILLLEPLDVTTADVQVGMQTYEDTGGTGAGLDYVVHFDDLVPGILELLDQVLP